MTKARTKIFYGWWIVFGAFLIDLYVGGTFSFGFTAFFKPLVDEFGWSYFAVSLAASIRGIESGITSPIAGFLADRWGPRRLVLVGVVVMGWGFILLSSIHSLGMFYLAFLVMAIGSSAASGIVLMAAVANWFDKKIGQAMGFMVTGFGAAGILVPVVVWIIGNYGWRTALVILGVSVWVVGIPASLLLRHKPEPYGYMPDGEVSAPAPRPGTPFASTVTSPVNPSQAGVNSTRAEVGPGEALRSRAFWMISLSMGIRVVLANAVAIHVMPYLIGIGFSQAAAAAITAAVHIFSIPGRIGLGWLGDKMDKRKVIAIAYTLMALGMSLFVYARVLPALVIFIVAFGIGNGGTVSLRAAIQREYFGRSAFGSIQGLMVAIMTVGSIAGPALAGWFYDATGSYKTPWSIFAALAALSIPMILLVRPPARKKLPSS